MQAWNQKNDESFRQFVLTFFFFYMAKNVKALALFKKKKLKKVLEDFRTLTKKKQICTEKHSLFLNSQYKRTRDLNSFNFCNFITGKNQKIRKVIFERNTKGRKNKRMNYGEQGRFFMSEKESESQICTFLLFYCLITCINTYVDKYIKVKKQKIKQNTSASQTDCLPCITRMYTFFFFPQHKIMK